MVMIKVHEEHWARAQRRIPPINYVDIINEFHRKIPKMTRILLWLKLRNQPPLLVANAGSIETYFHLESWQWRRRFVPIEWWPHLALEVSWLRINFSWSPGKIYFLLSLWQVCVHLFCVYLTFDLFYHLPFSVEPHLFRSYPNNFSNT